ncbi:DNA repair protein rad50 [Cadophora gregata f. sp. sojae]|nr:DNA repair protein rad50 [Cadophora gregata f. sp. sojae]
MVSSEVQYTKDRKYPSSSSITKLDIRGIRSFDSADHQTIQFHAPLTLIVGINGSGKTSIIECLKYATTGILPPNTKNGAFIHDPKLNGVKEVMAQVKLGFHNASQAKLVINRSLSLTVAKASVKQKTLECNLLIKARNGERTSISTKVGELDKIVPQHLGVSSAILEAVIFCHQDESLWPMSEPSKLKLRFDEIFEAQKYTKAIDNIIKIFKLQKIELGKLKIHEANFKELKDKAERVKQRSHDLQAEIAALEIKQQSLKVEIVAAEKISQEKHLLKAEALGIAGKLEQKRSHAEFLQSSLDSLRTNLVELKESDEWLEATLNQYEERMAQYRDQANEYAEQYQKLLDDAKACRGRISQKEIEQGQHQATKQAYEENLVKRVDLIHSTSQEYSLRGYDGDLEDSQISDFVQRVQKLSRDKERELESVKKATADELRQTQGNLTKLDQRKATLNQEKVNASQAITANDKNIRRRQADMSSINMDEGAKAKLDTALSDAEESLAKANSDWDAASWDQNLKAEKANLKELEQEAARLGEELFQINKLAKDRAALEYAKKEAKNARKSLETMISTHQEQLNELIGGDWTPDTLQEEFEAVLEQRTHTVKDLKSQQDSAVQQLSQTQFELKTARTTATKKKTELEKNEAKVLASITDEDDNAITSLEQWKEEYESLEQDYANHKSGIAGSSALLSMYTQFLNSVNSKDCCQLCERAFTDQKQRHYAAAKLEKLVAKQNEAEKKKDLDEAEALYKAADRVRPLYDVCMKLRDVEIPALEKDIKRLEAEKTSRVSTAERQDRLLNDEESAKRDIEALGKTVNDITAYNRDISKHEKEITRLASQETFTSTMSIEEIREQSDACNDKIRILKTKTEKMDVDKESARVEIVTLEKQVGNFSQQVASAKHLLEKKQALAAVVEELRESNNQQRSVISKADSELESLEPQFAKANAQHEDVQRRGNAKAKEVQGDKDKLSQTVNRFKLIEDAINTYIDNDGPGQIEACGRSIKLLKKELDRYEKETQQVTKKSNDLKTQLADGDNTKRSIQDNIRFRKSVRDLESVNGEIAELETHNATEDYHRYLREAAAADKRVAKLTAERGPIIGSMYAKDEDLGKIMTEWEIDYKDAAANYRKAHVEVETTKAAIEDLQKCSKALDNAIMQFHSVKMEEINNIAADLWQKTYQGTDVDTIMIKSENENPSTASSTRRNFNYRVVMVKQDAEMDMRGRCSAGQKVLACIIIRLALAECFGANCGVIALDEPTTNLDQDNIKALAVSLHKIIESRRHQPNFQLIIITHDEEFLKEMKCSDFTDSYYRVSRNAAQKSEIERQSLTDFMG